MLVLSYIADLVHVTGLDEETVWPVPCVAHVNCQAHLPLNS